MTKVYNIQFDDSYFDLNINKIQLYTQTTVYITSAKPIQQWEAY